MAACDADARTRPGEPLTDGDWEILARVAVRTTGFPIEYLHQLRYSHTAQLISSLLLREAEIAALHRTLLKNEFPRAVTALRDQGEERELLAECSAARRAVGRWLEVRHLEALEQRLHALGELLRRWNALLRSRQELSARVRKTWEAEHAEGRRQLYRIVAQERVQEAIYLSNPGVYSSLQRSLLAGGEALAEHSAARKLERRLVTYLQRLCIKNETQSFFGPINYGLLASDQEQVLQLRYAPAELRQRCGFPSQWMAQALAEAISAEPELRPYMQPRRETHCLLREGRMLVFPANGRIQQLDERAAWLFERADGQQTVIELAHCLHEDWTITWQLLEQLRRWRALVLHVLVPGNTSDPLDYLQRWLAHLPESAARRRWVERVHLLHTQVESFASAPFPERIAVLEQMEALFTSVCGQPARRATGAMYVDRSLVFEECLGNLEQCTFGGRLARQLRRDLPAIFTLWYTYGQLQARRDRRIAYQLYQRLLAHSGSAVPLLAYLQAAQQEIGQDTRIDQDDCAPFLQQVRELVSARSDGHVARLRAADLPGAAVAQTQPAYTSPDVMIAAEDLASLQAGRYQIVLGEGHTQALLLVFPTAHFLTEEERANLRAVLANMLPGEAAVPAQLLGTRTNKIFPYMLTETQVELRPFYPDTRAIPIAAVEIRELEGSLALWAQGRYLCLHPPLKRLSEHFDPLTPFALPCVRPPVLSLGDHTPRIEIDGIVCQREHWTLATDEVKTQGAKGSELFLRAWRWKERYGLPQEVFVRAPHEPKPVYIDFTSYFLVELLCHLADGCNSLVVSEMLPASHQLWLKQADGHHSCELRMLSVHTNSHAR